MTATRAFLLGLSLSLLAGLATPTDAEAKFVLINVGDEIFSSGPLPEPWAQRSEYTGWQAGYKCEVIGVFWAYAHAWDCKPVAYKDNTFDDGPDLVQAIAAEYAEDDKQMGWWGRHGRWLFAGLFIVGVFAGAGDDD
jgi:hypothetical protein